MATAVPCWANSSAVARPRPVAPPVTMTTRPWTVSASRCGSGRVSVAGAPGCVAPCGAAIQEAVRVKISNLCSKLNIGKARRNLRPMKRLAPVLAWAGISILTAAVCTYAVAYRFYSKFLAARVFGLDDRRATPAERCNNGRDFVPTNKWVLYGHHFAAIAGAGPLVGPVLAAQFGFLPGTLWLVI